MSHNMVAMDADDLLRQIKLIKNLSKENKELKQAVRELAKSLIAECNEYTTKRKRVILKDVCPESIYATVKRVMEEGG